MGKDILELSDDSLRSCLTERKVPILLSFWAPWSGPCTLAEKTLREIAYDYSKKLLVTRINVDENAHAPAEYGVRDLPHMVLFHEGKVLGSILGPQPKSKILEFIERHLSNYPW